MLNQPTIEKLQAMKLHGMADAFRQQIETPDPASSALRSDSDCWSIANGMEGEHALTPIAISQV